MENARCSTSSYRILLTPTWYSDGQARVLRSWLSFVVAAIACGFAALCYAELASMIPVSGSAYTYFIRNARRDHRVDHRLGSDSGIRGREHGRSRSVGRVISLQSVRKPVSDLKFPLWLVNDYRTASGLLSHRWRRAQRLFVRPRLPDHCWAIRSP